MKNQLFYDLRKAALRSLFDGLTFEQARGSQDWDDLSCEEQMSLEDLLL